MGRFMPHSLLPRPDRAALVAARRLLLPLEKLIAPEFHGCEGVPRRGPLLFVGNHTLIGMLDAPFLVAHLFDHHGILLRALGDHAHFKLPLWGELLGRYGVVDGTRENCAALMQQGEAILVFPGGAREVTKERGEAYRLLWGQRLGFARMAVAHGCTIVPFAAVGVEDALDIVWDRSDVQAVPLLGTALDRLGVRLDLIPPVVKGIGPTPVPRPERLYFRFSAPIDPRDFSTDARDDVGCAALRDAVRDAVEEGIVILKDRQASDPNRGLRARIARGVRRSMPRRS